MSQPEKFGAEHRAMADAKLRQAIEYHAEAYQLDADGDLLNDFIVIVHWATMDDVRTSTYTKAVSSLSMPVHVARGLLHQGLIHLQ
jgi:hypothetical protein